MNKYRKGMLSAVAALAISSSMLYADYMPLTTSANDDSWVLFGVNGYFGASSTSGISGEFTIDALDANRWVDDDNDAMTAVGSLTDPLAALSDSWGQLDVTNQAYDVEVRVDVSGLGTPDPTDPVRRMYVKDINGNIVFSFTYRASLESLGKKLEFQLTNTTQKVYEVALQSGATYDDPVAVTSADLAGGGVVSNTDSFNSLDPSDNTKHMVDFNLTNNPADPSKYAAQYNDVKDANDVLSIYGYDASNGTWLYFDSRNAIGFNDFMTLEKGKAYWAKIDADGDSGANKTNTGAKKAGLVLGSEAVGASDFTGKLYEGWNLISFGDTNTEIRRSTTGMLAAIDTTGSASIKLYDSMLNQSVTVNFDVNATDDIAAQNINYAIAKGKVDGTIQRVFDLKAFPTATAGTLALMSNKKFGIEDTNGSIITTLSTMAGSNVWVDTNNTSAGTSTNPAAGSVYTSAYDEYFLIVDPMVGAGTAEALGLTAKVNVVTHDSAGAVDKNQLVTIDTDLATATAALNAVTNTIQIDVDQDGTLDYALMSSTNPFYLRDFTISRVYDFDASGTTFGMVEAIGLGATYADLNITIPDTNATNVASLINGKYGLAATVDSNDNIIVISADGNSTADPIKSSVNFALSYTSGDNKLKVTDANGIVTSSTDYVKGSIGSVYGPNTFITATTKNSLTIDLNTTSVPGYTANNHDINYTITVQNLYDINFTATEINSTVADTLDNLVIAINTALSDQNITSTAAKATNNEDIIISGYDLIAVAMQVDLNSTLQNVDLNTTAGRGYIRTTGLSGITSDLQYNSVYSPNYVMDGPLYTINEAGFKLSALVSGTTQMSDGSINWESIDLTRDTSEWLDSQDYNLFQTDERAGYWAFLDPIETNTMAIADPATSSDTSVNSVGYTTYYDGSTAVNFFNGSINVRINNIDVDALADDAVRVIASTTSGSVELTQSGTPGADYADYTGKISMYPSTGATFSVDVEVADGIGNKITDAGNAILTIDNVKPDAPAVNYSNGDLTITASTSADAKGYYVFQNEVPEKAPTSSTDYLSHFTADDMVAGEKVLTGICANASDVQITDAAGSLNVIAIDGSVGDFGTGNSSDITSTAFMPIAKSRVVLYDNGTGNTDASTGGTPYDSNCTAGTATTQNIYALQLTAYEPEVEIAFVNEVEAAVPYTDAQLVNVNYISIDGTEAGIVAHVKFRDDYIGKTFFIKVNDGSTIKVYGGTLSGTQYDNSAAPMDVSTGLKTGVTSF